MSDKRKTKSELIAELDELRRLYEAAAGDLGFFKSILDQSPDAIVTTDTKGKITYWTPGCRSSIP